MESHSKCAAGPTSAASTVGNDEGGSRRRWFPGAHTDQSLVVTGCIRPISVTITKHLSLCDYKEEVYPAHSFGVLYNARLHVIVVGKREQDSSQQVGRVNLVLFTESQLAVSPGGPHGRGPISKHHTLLPHTNTSGTDTQANTGVGWDGGGVDLKQPRNTDQPKARTWPRDAKGAGWTWSRPPCRYSYTFMTSASSSELSPSLL